MINRVPLGTDRLMRRRALAMPTACLRQRYLRLDFGFEAFAGDLAMAHSIRSDFPEQWGKTDIGIKLACFLSDTSRGKPVPSFSEALSKRRASYRKPSGWKPVPSFPEALVIMVKALLTQSRHD